MGFYTHKIEPKICQVHIYNDETMTGTIKTGQTIKENGILLQHIIQHKMSIIHPIQQHIDSIAYRRISNNLYKIN